KKKAGTLDHALKESNAYKAAKSIIEKQMPLFGDILVNDIIPELKEGNIHWIYNEPIPEAISATTRDYFYERLAAFVESTILDKEPYFPNNDQLYFIFTYKEGDVDRLGIMNIPSDQISRFYTVPVGDITYVAFIDDIIRQNITAIFPDHTITGLYALKVTRDAELELDNGFDGPLAAKIEKLIKKRDLGPATPLWYHPHLPKDHVRKISKHCDLQRSNTIKGGNYHNLKDFFSFPIHRDDWKYPPQPP